MCEDEMGSRSSNKTAVGDTGSGSTTPIHKPRSSLALTVCTCSALCSVPVTIENKIQAESYACYLPRHLFLGLNRIKLTSPMLFSTRFTKNKINRWKFA